MSRFRKLFCVLLVIAGTGLYLYPDVKTWLLEKHTGAYIREFEEKYASGRGSGENPADTPETEAVEDAEIASMENNPLYLECVEYNQKIYADGQTGLADAWSYEQPGLTLEEFPGDGFGYIEIPSIGVTLPLYLGASEENMAKGAAVMGQTSLPVGGEDTNCVIAGHRGYRGAPYFREIEKLSVGDLVYVTNPWETLVYQVISIDVIDPYDSDAVKIQEGKDMVTLLTCHPYRSHGKYRYVVYCERCADDGKTEDGAEAAGKMGNAGDTAGAGNVGENTGSITTPDGRKIASSEADIHREGLVRKLAGAVILLLAGAAALRLAERKRRRERGGDCPKKIETKL